jgi:hypothetical protein
MTKLLDRAFEIVRDLPPDGQDDIARVMLRLTPEEQDALAASRAAAARGEFATDEQVRTVWIKYGL